MGKLRDAGQTSRPIIIKFIRYNNRKNVLNRKKKLKETNFTEITAINNLNKKVEQGQGN